MTTFLTATWALRYPLTVIAGICLGLWCTSGYLANLNARAEENRRRKDRASWLAFMAHEQRRADAAADEATLAVADAFRVAMADHEQALTEFRHELDQYGKNGAA